MMDTPNVAQPSDEQKRIAALHEKTAAFLAQPAHVRQPPVVAKSAGDEAYAMGMEDVKQAYKEGGLGPALHNLVKGASNTVIGYGVDAARVVKPAVDFVGSVFTGDTKSEPTVSGLAGTQINAPSQPAPAGPSPARQQPGLEKGADSGHSASEQEALAMKPAEGQNPATATVTPEGVGPAPGYAKTPTGYVGLPSVKGGSIEYAGPAVAQPRSATPEEIQQDLKAPQGRATPNSRLMTPEERTAQQKVNGGWEIPANARVALPGTSGGTKVIASGGVRGISDGSSPLGFDKQTMDAANANMRRGGGGGFLGTVGGGRSGIEGYDSMTPAQKSAANIAMDEKATAAIRETRNAQRAAEGSPPVGQRRTGAPVGAGNAHADQWNAELAATGGVEDARREAQRIAQRLPQKQRGAAFEEAFKAGVAPIVAAQKSGPDFGDQVRLAGLQQTGQQNAITNNLAGNRLELDAVKAQQEALHQQGSLEQTRARDQELKQYHEGEQRINEARSSTQRQEAIEKFLPTALSTSMLPDSVRPQAGAAITEAINTNIAPTIVAGLWSQAEQAALMGSNGKQVVDPKTLATLPPEQLAPIMQRAQAHFQQLVNQHLAKQRGPGK